MVVRFEGKNNNISQKGAFIGKIPFLCNHEATHPTPININSNLALFARL